MIIPQDCEYSSDMEIEDTKDTKCLDECSYSKKLLNGNIFEKIYNDLFDEHPSKIIFEEKKFFKFPKANFEDKDETDEYLIEENKKKFDDQSESDFEKDRPDFFPFTKSKKKNPFTPFKTIIKMSIRDIKRKDKKDDMKKKLKASFLKALIKRVNEKLKSANSEKFFVLLPQLFVADVSKRLNYKYLNITIYDILNTDFSNSTDTGNDNKNRINQEKYQNNHMVLEYLDNNEEVLKKSEFDIIKNMIYKELYEAYIKSDEFWKLIEDMKTGRKPESPEYINKFTNVAKDLIKDLHKGKVE